ncbi:hypothetical protein PRIPAC_77996 [Pristionchus pacificus]|uniref:Uncharacterized protein n=1 Tax=Pristionchus pacificus TaxID=54126 RepID=A0A2A6CQP1_PRIPA|nr:hypothetical protein PRIPAC_77996 [Pristionchus pacificus]|eukprot:PDM80406.1 hypothetical protein PRIPAC_32985 [Pristionchus pacificus]
MYLSVQVFKQKTLIFVASKSMTLGVFISYHPPSVSPPTSMVESMMAASQETQTNGADVDKVYKNVIKKDQNELKFYD